MQDLVDFDIFLQEKYLKGQMTSNECDFSFEFELHLNNTYATSYMFITIYGVLNFIVLGTYMNTETKFFFTSLNSVGFFLYYYVESCFFFVWINQLNTYRSPPILLMILVTGIFYFQKSFFLLKVKYRKQTLFGVMMIASGNFFAFFLSEIVILTFPLILVSFFSYILIFELQFFFSKKQNIPFLYHLVILTQIIPLILLRWDSWVLLPVSPNFEFISFVLIIIVVGEVYILITYFQQLMNLRQQSLLDISKNPNAFWCLLCNLNGL